MESTRPPPGGTEHNEPQDVLILGGGLAGLCLALQLKQRLPELGVTVVERRKHPVPAAAHKVGESTVEIGAHYFADVLGMRAHLQRDQLKKFGFRFFFNDGIASIDKVTELGASTFLKTDAWQIDRGIFENALGVAARDLGVQFEDGALVRRIAMASAGSQETHLVTCERDGLAWQLQARWLVDASGRAGLLKRKLGLTQDNDHHANAVWFRIAGRIDVDEWSDDPQWLARCDPPHRWLSTNHLCGEGYWVWLIPLSSGSHSVGIVCDAQTHPIDTMNTFDKAMEWLSRHQPRLHAELEQRPGALQDFLWFKDFSYGCSQVWSGDGRWALTGDAGLFLDPFYSPGSDFIAIGNTFITELVAHDLSGRPTAMYAEIYQSVFFSLYRNMLPIYTGQYGIFGNAEVMPVKVLWDYTYYWGVMCQLYFQHKLTDVATMGRMQKTLGGVHALNIAVQDFLRAWSEAGEGANPARMLDQASLPWFAELNRGLCDTLDKAAFDARMERHLALLDELARQIVSRAQASHSALDATDVHAALGPDRDAAWSAQNLLALSGEPQPLFAAAR